MTRLGFWMSSVGIALLVVGLVGAFQYSLAFLGLTLLLWIGFEWTLFRLRADVVARRLRVERKVNGQAIGSAILWQGQGAHVELRVTTGGILGLSGVHVVDIPPKEVDRQGPFAVRGASLSRKPLLMEYDIRPRIAGQIRFIGQRIELTSPTGLFEEAIFLPEQRVVTVWPSIVSESSRSPTTKRFNRLPGQGSHRHMRPGSGSDLLQLRPYQLGDPPRRIAWKLFARTGQLTVKEYESETPIRTTLLVDHSDSVRVGWPGPTALTQSVEISASLVRQLIEQRDPTSLYLVDEFGSLGLPHGVGSRHRSRLMQRLCEVSSDPPRPTFCPAASIAEPLQSLCEVAYPELLDPRLNPRDFRSEWPWRRVAGSGAHWFLLFLLVLFVGGGFFAWQLSRGATLAIAGLVLVGLLGLAILWARHRWMSPTQGTFHQRRKRLSAVLAAVFRSGPSGLARGIVDDEYFSRQAQRMLIEHRVPYHRPLHDHQGRYVFHRPEKIAWAAKTLLRLVMHGQDDEVFILMIDLLEHETEWSQLIEAIKVARLRHHQVLLICPWPSDLPLPSGSSEAQAEMESEPTAGESAGDSFDQLSASWGCRYHHAFHAARRQLGRFGVSLIPAQGSQTTREILERIEVLRSARIRSNQRH